MTTTAILFDFDGLIADTESAVYEAWNSLYRENGVELDVADWVRCVGTGWDVYNPEEALEKKTGKSFDWPSVRDSLKSREASLLSDLQTLPGVRERLAEARELGIPCAVASSSPHHWVDPWLQNFELRGFFREVVCLEDTGKVAKPEPDLFLLAAKKLDVPPAECLVLEDSLNGLLAAQAAGMPCCIVPNPVTAGLDFAGASLQLPSLADRSLTELLALPRA